ncbi:MAG: S8/S53 family peptidase, partial [Geodermatophilaceae bacterium]|nr:S8/S53 family peptidase [Geodermatophilaceae bacterium]
MVAKGAEIDGSDNKLGIEERRRLTRRQRDLIASGGAMGSTCLYVPGELLVARQDEERLRGILEENGALRGVRFSRSGRDRGDFDGAAGGYGDEPDPIVGESLDERLGIVRYSMSDPSRDVVELVRAIQRFSDRDDDGPAPVSLHHVLSGEPLYMGGPGDEPGLAPEFRVAEAQTVEARLLAVLDTGVALGLQDVHAQLFDVLTRDSDDADVLDSDNDKLLDAEAGHGTFIAGLVRRLAPEVGIRMKRVLNPYGFGTDLSVSTGVLAAETPVLNMSLGGYTLDDRPPPILANVLNQLGREVVVVAAAGNNASDRPFWPAACKQVIAV